MAIWEQSKDLPQGLKDDGLNFIAGNTVRGVMPNAMDIRE